MITALIDLMGACHQAGNLSQVEAIARSILAAIPEDMVALQFLGLALYQMGRIESARQVFRRVVAAGSRRAKKGAPLTTGELATVTVYREAARPGAGLGETWQHVAHAMHSLGFRRAATRAYQTSLIAKGIVPAPAMTGGAGER